MEIMSVSLYSPKIVQNMLFLQLLVLVFTSVIFSFKSVEWCISALTGGMAVWIPNIIFMLFTCHHQTQAKAIVFSHIAWSFVIGEGGKIIFTIIFLMIALRVFKAEFLPLSFTWLSVFIAQTIAPAVSKDYRIEQLSRLTTKG